MLRSLKTTASCIALALAVSNAAVAADAMKMVPAAPAAAQSGRSAPTAANPQSAAANAKVANQNQDQTAEKRKQITAEAIAAVSETSNALKDLDEGKKDADSFGMRAAQLLMPERRKTMSMKKNRKDYAAPYEFSDAWDDVLLGDRDVFKEMTEPFIPALIEAARQDIKREKALGNLTDRILAEELAGDALIQAWTRRYSRSPRESILEWLLANQRWALRLLVLSEKEWTERKALSLEEPAKSRLADNDDWDVITPQFVARPCWRDVIADENSVSRVA